ncbi:MAG: IS3 family transposase, partial [Lachnospiraceae bacterium]|nr:IS3 family transposase [Lachnospiraceae bacterium]
LTKKEPFFTKDTNFFTLPWGILKSEMYYLQLFHTFEELEKAIDEYIVFYNTRRLQAKLKGLAPLAFRNQTLVA